MIRSSSTVVYAAFSIFLAACGGAVSREIPGDPAAQPPAVPVGADPSAPPGSSDPGIAPSASGQGTCVTLVGGPSTFSIATVDLAKGTVDVGPAIAHSGSGPGPTSLGVVGDEVVFCASHSDGSGTGTIVRASRVDGSTKVISKSCDAVTATSEGVWVLSMYEQTLARYASLDALAAGKPLETLKAPTASRLGPSSEGVVSAWHSTDEIDHVGSKGVSPVKLEGFDGWVYGVSALPDGRLVVASPRGLGGLAGLVLFDGATGKNQGVVVKAPGDGPFGFSGLSCMPRGS